MKTSSAKQKGRILQQLIRNLILTYFPLLPDDVRSTSMGVSGVDLQLSPVAQQMFPFAIECKNQEAVTNLYTWWQQAEKNKGALTPLLCIKKNYNPTLVVMDVNDFFKLLKEKHDALSKENK